MTDDDHDDDKDDDYDDGDVRWADLKSRIVEHNIRMMAKNYTKIRLAR